MPLELALLAVPLLIALNAFFVSAEYAVVAARPAVMEILRHRNRHRALAAMEALTRDPASAIGAIQICITMTNLLIGWIAEPAMSSLLHRLFDPLIEIAPRVMFFVATSISFIVVTLITVVFSELLPKALTLKYVAAAASVTAVPVLLVQKAAYPLVRLMNAMANAVTVPLRLGRVDEPEKQQLSIAEIQMQIAQATEDGIITPRERSLILNSLTIGRRRADEIDIPRVRVVYLDLQRSIEENFRIVDEHLFSRMPVCNGGMDHVIGVIHVKEFLTAYNAHADNSVLQLLAEKPVFVPQNVPLDRVLTVMQEQRTQFVLLVDEFGGVTGIVTLQDVVDELLGEEVQRLNVG
jgi:CBS domain containing-hemolysin-like protein